MAEQPPPPASASSSSSSKPPKPPKQPKPNAPSASSETAAAGAAKAKSAKELKKEKRAAAVAARAVGDAADPSLSPNPSSSSPNLNGEASSSSSPRAAMSSQPPRRPGALGAPSTQQQPSYLPSAPLPLDPTSPLPTFFAHLPQPAPPPLPQAFASGRLHPVIIRLGVLMSNGKLRGANARTMGMMAAFQEVIRDYQSPEEAVLWKDLPVHLSPMIAWLEGCRPKGVGGGNAIRWLKGEINRLGELGGRTEAEQKEHLVESIDIYLRDRIEYADQVIADHAKQKIKPGDTVVTYARSSVVERVLLEAWRDMREDDPEAEFSVVVVDSRPLNEGRATLDVLISAGLPCTYTLLPLVSSLLPRCSLVLIGASALHSDGALFSRAGTAMLATLAKEHRVPVVACVETYKFGERVVLDGVATNELGEGAEVLRVPGKKHGAEADEDKGPGGGHLTALSLVYDLTPPSLITAVCTEIGFIPPSSVPTVLGKASNVL